MPPRRPLVTSPTRRSRAGRGQGVKGRPGRGHGWGHLKSPVTVCLACPGRSSTYTKRCSASSHMASASVGRNAGAEPSRADASLPPGQTIYWLGDGVGTHDHPFTDPASDEGSAGMAVVQRLEMPDDEVVEIRVNESARPLSESELSSIAAAIVPVDGTQKDIDYYTRPRRVRPRRVGSPGHRERSRRPLRARRLGARAPPASRARPKPRDRGFEASGSGSPTIVNLSAGQEPALRLVAWTGGERFVPVRPLAACGQALSGAWGYSPPPNALASLACVARDRFSAVRSAATLSGASESSASASVRLSTSSA